MEVKPDETGKAIVPVLACVLNQLCMRNDKLPMNQKNVSKFHALRPPAITIKDYLSRIAKYAACSGECFVLALVYIDRIIQTNPTFVVNSLNIHRLLITSVMLAAKFFDDQYFNNAYYAKVGGVPCNEMNSLEVEFLFMTNFTLFVATDTYKQYYTELCNHAQNSTCGCSTQPIPKLVIPGYGTKPRSDSRTDRDSISRSQKSEDGDGSSTISVSTTSIGATTGEKPTSIATIKSESQATPSSTSNSTASTTSTTSSSTHSDMQ